MLRECLAGVLPVHSVSTTYVSCTCECVSCNVCTRAGCVTMRGLVDVALNSTLLLSPAERSYSGVLDEYGVHYCGNKRLYKCR